METLLPLAAQVAILLKQRRETIAIAESSSGGLLSAALLAIPGASTYFLAGAVVYTHRARKRLLDIPREAVEGMRSASEPYDGTTLASLFTYAVYERHRPIPLEGAF